MGPEFVAPRRRSEFSARTRPPKNRLDVENRCVVNEIETGEMHEATLHAHHSGAAQE